LPIFVASNEFKVSFCFTMVRDGTYETFPASIVSAYYTFLLRFASGTLNVRHRFYWKGVC